MKKDKNKYRTLRTHFLSTKHDVMYCSSCNGVILFLNVSAYSYLLFNYNCRCGSHGYVESYPDDIPQIKGVFRELYKDNFSHSCPAEDFDIFSVNKNNVISYAYRVICVCGDEFSGGEFVG